MEYVKALLIKGVLTLIILYLVLGLGYEAPFAGILLLTLVLVLLSYPGDLFILPKIKNVTATLTDFVLIFLVVWAALAWFMPVEGSVVLAALISAVLIAIAEYGFHIYLASRGLLKPHHKYS